MSDQVYYHDINTRFDVSFRISSPNMVIIFSLSGMKRYDRASPLLLPNVQGLLFIVFSLKNVFSVTYTLRL